MCRSLSYLPELLLWLRTPGSPFLSKISPPSSKQVHFCVWSQYFPPRQWRLLFRLWLLSKLTWLNWLRANELVDWSCQAPQEVMLLHLWGATPATATICCLGMSQGLKKKKSKNYREHLRRCVYSDQLSVMTHSDEHTRARRNKAAETQTSIYAQCNFCIMVSNVTFKGACVSPWRNSSKPEWSCLAC